MNLRWKLGLLGAAVCVLVATYLLIDLGGSWDYAFPRRIKKILAILLTGSAIAYSTVIFQTITHNRILTPSIIGLDSLYMLLQTFIVFSLGSLALTAMNQEMHFLLSASLMVLFAGVLYKLLFRSEGRHIYFLLLVGVIFGTLFGSLSSFMQMLIDPNEFQVVQDRMFASMNSISGSLLLLAGTAFVIVFLYSLRYVKYLDVLSLGREHAVNLGLDVHKLLKRLLMIVAVLTSIATALVGPITFLGLIVANVAYAFIRDYRHRFTIPVAVLFGIIALVGGQLLVERVFAFTTTLSVIINMAGGLYFIFLLIKENRA